ncbi:MAG: hypothetical protein ACRCUE_12080 [Bosea sp. (in: a-proteobacteria)]
MKVRSVFLVAAAAVATALAVLPAQAQYYSPPGVPYYNPNLPPPPHERGYRPPRYAEPPRYQEPQGYGPISCGEGAEIIASQGFRNISIRECGGRVFRYTAYRRGAPFEVRVASRTGEITMIRPI